MTLDSVDLHQDQGKPPHPPTAVHTTLTLRFPPHPTLSTQTSLGTHLQGSSTLAPTLRQWKNSNVLHLAYPVLLAVFFDLAFGCQS